MKLLTILSLFFQISFTSSFAQTSENLEGSWKGENAIYTFSDGYYSYAAFTANDFTGTHGGKYEVADDKLKIEYEYNTFDNNAVGTVASEPLSYSENEVTINGEMFTRYDDGSPGKLEGAWLITGRMRDGEINERTPGPRKTMKILSGKRFQWIAYNTETKDFMGTGGGTYTTENGKYVEHIDFFSRDQSRVGASLPFTYELRDGKWHHSGKSSKGDPIYEIWTKRVYL